MPTSQRNPRIRPVFKISAIDDQEKFKPVPVATGSYPFRLAIKDVFPAITGNKLTFHMAGDTGTTRMPDFQQGVVTEMIRQCNEAVPDHDKPKFLFHLGDIVYNFGQASQYYNQFFNPYRNYPAPVFAIPGNHDADIDPLEKDPPQSLEAFRTVFCDTQTRPLALAEDTGRPSNVQPNVYWILETPLADIIGLYSNVPKFGNVQQDQRRWFIEALKNSATGKKAIIVCVHHAPYSADTNHGSSIHMQALLDGSFRESKVVPDVVFSGHVHNYQRFNKKYGKKTVPFIVSGAGGYSDLHPLAEPSDPAFPDDSCLLNDVELQNYCDDQHGFLKVSIEKKSNDIIISGDYYVTDETPARLYDSFSIIAGK